MNHDEFRKAWDDALLLRGLLSHGDRAEEVLSVSEMERRYSVRVGMFSGGQPAEPFLGSAELKWSWDALKAARTRSTEEDLLTELLGREVKPAGEPLFLRVDITLAGKLPHGAPLHFPSPEVWRAWLDETIRRVEPLLPSERASPGGPVESWRGEPEAQVRFGPGGEPWLLGVELAAWQAIHIPRQWGDRDREPDDSPEQQLEAFAGRVHGALLAWKGCLKELLPPVSTPTVLH